MSESSNTALKVVGIGCLLVVVIGLGAFGACTVCAGAVVNEVGEAAVEASEQAAVEQAAEDQANVAAEAQLPWLATARQHCTDYDAAPNDIQKSAIFQENVAFVTGQELTGIRGSLVSLITAHGGGGLILSVDVGEAGFAEGGIEEGDDLYTSSADLVVGQCVVISGSVRGPSEAFERSKVCDFEYRFTFAEIRACPAEP